MPKMKKKIVLVSIPLKNSLVSLMKNFWACDLIWAPVRVPICSSTFFQFFPNFVSPSMNLWCSSLLQRPLVRPWELFSKSSKNSGCARAELSRKVKSCLEWYWGGGRGNLEESMRTGEKIFEVLMGFFVSINF